MRADFGSVRVHDGSAADAAARGVSAHAYTVGSDIVFASGRYAPQTREGRALLAHELVHVIQQRGAAPPAADQDLPIARDTSDYEVDARHAAQRAEHDAPVPEAEPAAGVVSAGAAVNRRAPRAMIMRQPAPAHAAEQSKKEPVTIEVPVDEDLSEDEFHIRAIMQLFDIDHDAAVKEIQDHGWAFYGHHDPARHGLIPFVVQLDPESVSRHELVEARRRQAVEALSSPKMNVMMSIGPPGRIDATHALGPGEAEALLQAAQIVDRMDLEDLNRYNRIIGGRAANWQDFLTDVTRFEGDQLSYRRAKAALSGDHDLLSAFAERNELLTKLPSAPWMSLQLDDVQKRLDDELKKRGFESEAAYAEQIAAPWRDAFQVRALELADAALDSAIANARAARTTIKDASGARTMWLALQAVKLAGVDVEERQDLLTAYPILRSTKARKYAMRFDDPKSFSWWMGSFALQMQVGCMNVKDVLRRQPERVFGLDAVVGATLAEMGLSGDSPQAQALALGLGDRKDHSFWSALLEIVDFLEYFIPGWGELKAIGNFLNESYEYELGKVEATADLRSSDPSVMGVVLSGVGAALPFVAPVAPAAIGKVARLGGRVGRWGLSGVRDLTLVGRMKVAEPILRGTELGGVGDLGRIGSSSLVETMAEEPTFPPGLGEPALNLPEATPDVAPTPGAPAATPDVTPTPSAPAVTPDVTPTPSAPAATPEADLTPSSPAATPEASITPGASTSTELAERGYRPRPGERSVAREDWRAFSSTVRAGNAIDRAFSETAPFQFGRDLTDIGRRRRPGEDVSVPSFADLNLAPDQVRAASRLFGSLWDASIRQTWRACENALARQRMAEVRRLWSLGTPASQQQARDLARATFDLWVGRFWRRVQRNATLSQRFEEAGLQVDAGRAPYYQWEDGYEEGVTIEHWGSRLSDDPTRAVEDTNLMFSMQRENVRTLEAIRAAAR